MKTKRQVIVGYVVLILFLVAILLPFYWMLVTSIKPDLEISAYPPTLFPHHWTFIHYATAFQQDNFGIYIRNSVIVAICSTFIVLALASMAGFAVARLPIPGKKTVLIALLIISVFPEIAVIAPLYVLLRDVNWLNSYQALIIPYSAFNMPFAVWILRNYFLEVPGALFEAAKMDGASVFQTFYRIFLPLTRPGLFAAAVFTFVASWTEFFMALVFNSSDTMRTIPVGIALFSGQYSEPYGTIFAGSVVSILPIVILVIIFRKWIVSGLTAGAVKG
ncbi:carbohydrate ABC transporter permease [Alicyclobacillus tolerans]|uniref:Carbohydrate ABC transporter membrane protein 2, CUT1 family n=1 Tax=Alicyclobacillus tolerans TaxID=90970 RepID=A0A1M6XMM6_9BACL|nr:carbohydrate ABC transporter permease [Alicyclobacillus montanus]SHL07260.1 carbohydrate ABC transporter membrane protein 2, CUT1 family [Alicyclobacillus montanus]